MDLADAAEDRVTSRWSRLRREYAISVVPDDCRKLLKVDYKPSDNQEVRNIVREIKTAYQEHVENDTYGVHLEVTLTDGSVKRYRRMRHAFRKSVSRCQEESQQGETAWEDFDQEAWQEAGCPPADEWDGD